MLFWIKVYLKYVYSRNTEKKFWSINNLREIYSLHKCHFKRYNKFGSFKILLNGRNQSGSPCEFEVLAEIYDLKLAVLLSIILQHILYTNIEAKVIKELKKREKY